MAEDRTWFPLAEAAQAYGLAYQHLYKLVQRGHVAAKRQGRSILVDRTSLEGFLPPPGWVYLADAVEQFPGVQASLLTWVKEGKVNARRRGVQWQVELASVQSIVESRYLPPPEDRPGWLTIPEAAGKMGVSVVTVRNYIRSGWIQAKKQGKQWLIVEATARKKDAAVIRAEQRRLVPPGWVLIREAAQQMELHQETLRQWIRKREMEVRATPSGLIVAAQELEKIKFRWVQWRDGREVARLEPEWPLLTD